MVGSTMMAMALSSDSAKLISPMAIGGMPMPIAPLAMPATMKAPAITSICSRVMRWGSCDEGFRQSVEGLPEPGADRVGLHHDLVLGAGDGEVLAVLQPAADRAMTRRFDQLVLGRRHQQHRQLDALEIARRQRRLHRAHRLADPADRRAAQRQPGVGL